MCLGELLSDVTPDAAMRLPWRYAMAVLTEAPQGEPGPGSDFGRVSPVPCKAGGVYPQWYSQLLRMGARAPAVSK